jgi:hypothetical protein
MSHMLALITSVTIAANDARLGGSITREQHAEIIAEINDRLALNGWTWDDVQNEIGRRANQFAKEA